MQALAGKLMIPAGPLQGLKTLKKPRYRSFFTDIGMTRLQLVQPVGASMPSNFSIIFSTRKRTSESSISGTESRRTCIS